MKKIMTGVWMAFAICGSLSAAAPADAFTTYKVSADMDGQTPNWAAGATYEGGTAPADLSQAKVVIDKITVNVNASTFTDFAKIGLVSFVKSDDSKCIIDTGNASLETPGAFYGEGWLVKRGSGALVLTTSGHIVNASATYVDDLRCYVDVQEGTLDFGKDKTSPSGTVQVRMYKLRVADEGTYVLVKNCENHVSYEFPARVRLRLPKDRK